MGMINKREIAVEASTLIKKSPKDPKLNHSRNTSQV
jgi:hypothetical protein